MAANAMLPQVRYLHRPEGRIAYTVRGDGPLVVCVPGMGDLRSTYRDLTPALLEAGYRVAEVDLRGHGESDTTFTRHGDAATGEDLLALVEALGGPAAVVGNSMGASAALWAAAERPSSVMGTVLLGPFVRDADIPDRRARLQRALFRAALLRPWGGAVWAVAYRSFAVGKDRRPRTGRDAGAVRGRLPVWFDDHVAALRQSLREPARLRSLRHLVGQLTHREVHGRLGSVHSPALVLMGAQDPDFRDPAAELAYIEDRLGAGAGPGRVRGVLVPECGHYPQYQRADVVVPEIVAFLAALRGSGDAWASPAPSTPGDEVPGGARA
jgi:pimeloyl-ACP methyl ester carboxylesterase